MTVGRKIHINGIVQGVGFRPFVYSAASEFAITGWVRNSSAGVDIFANGEEKNVEQFISKLKSQPPPLSKIDVFQIEPVEADGFIDFQILSSQGTTNKFVPISPDVSICADCQGEMFDPSNRRYRYPFINCTNCGPRFTIIKDIPYDRPFTTMAGFEMCEDCQTEYENPLDRRFHAQPIACPICGPQIWLDLKEGKQIFAEEGLLTARRLIAQGKILAIKGLGGFHLACDAMNAEVVQKLRTRKKRSEKAFAVMVANLQIAKNFCQINDSEAFILNSKEKPIVLLERRPEIDVPEGLAPNKNTLGVMLPYTPLHLLLMEMDDDLPQMLVMTSGNISDEPIAYANSDAIARLGDIADGFLLNNRDIHTRIDDSVLAVRNDQPYFFRRARGFAPNPIRTSEDFTEILAVGPELKNTFCLTRDHYAFVSHHIGDMENLETYKAFEEGIKHYQSLFKIHPKIIAHDLHPDYLSTSYAENRSKDEGIPSISVQHHHAHLASCLIDNSWVSDNPVLGVCFDGTGYGADGKIWGGEVLLGGYRDYKRVAHFEYMPLPGGDAAIQQPRRTALAYLLHHGINLDPDIASVNSFSSIEIEILAQQVRNGINTPYTSSVGRLFDVVSSLTGVCQISSYEAQAAIDLESIANPCIPDCYSLDLNGETIEIRNLLEEILFDMKKRIPKAEISAKFHNAIAKLVLDVSKIFAETYKIDTIALTGGVWQNLYLLEKTLELFDRTSINVLIHHQVPPNDGGVSLGQAVIANYHKFK